MKGSTWPMPILFPWVPIKDPIKVPIKDLESPLKLLSETPKLGPSDFMLLNSEAIQIGFL